ncbi:MAG: acyl-CoA dehydrogenase [Deltaproteobacteria bacterium]|jgi:acyl-CoA dehydrogenase|nr:acyl-CoA dehydrogenase [Deltaproteobacteria bacterium]MBT4091792.1 acyl-CoA dehydrogenase [Deltaproteobacteria bacterium]MBT4264849.1 acyl-CoA dehydrogenase [Deltaproteobacteria bacterium]MBT4640065.1 acyl-CoA dehydrogenase [Deltaproteobacteria bacterium]MBT6498835.1 acyl-CoA dehydrogenase [Deltaproteobacteria bacterium]
MISLELTEELKQSRTNMHNLARDLFRPIARKYDIEEHTYPKELDILRPPKPKKDSSEAEKKPVEVKEVKKDKKPAGPKYDNLIGVLSVEELCWGDLGLMLTFPGMGLGNAAISAVGTPEQKIKFGSRWAAMAITEPEAGSDSAAVQTTAVLDGDEWVINGEKIFVTSADRSEIVVVWANIEPSAGKAGIKSFIVEKGTPGFKLEHLEHKLGIRASDTGTFVLKDCRVPRENLLGSAEVKKKQSFAGVMQTFDNTRPTVAAMALGVARAAMEFTKEKIEESGMQLDYANSGYNMSSIHKEFYRMESNLEAMRLLIWQAASMADAGIRNSLQASMCKAKAGKAGTEIVQKCCEILGPLGYTYKNLAEKWMRDVKITDIFEGTGQIQHLIVARQLMKLSSKDLK